jgi:hypothetical protein
MKLTNFFLVEKLTTYVNRQDFSQNLCEKFAFYGLDMEPDMELVKSWNLNRNRNLSKVGTETGSVTFQKLEAEAEP